MLWAHLTNLKNESKKEKLLPRKLNIPKQSLRIFTEIQKYLVPNKVKVTFNIQSKVTMQKNQSIASNPELISKDECLEGTQKILKLKNIKTH